MAPSCSRGPPPARIAVATRRIGAFSPPNCVSQQGTIALPAPSLGALIRPGLLHLEPAPRRDVSPLLGGSRTFARRLALAALLLAGACAPAAAVTKRIYIANDDHTDYMWSGDDVQYRTAFIDMLDYYQSQAEATATNPVDARSRFNCDGTMWLWEYEHHKTPAEFARLMGHVQAGDITVPLNTAVLCYGGSPAEAVLRGMYYAGRLERRYNMRLPLVEAMENQTLPAGLASLWAGAGAKYSWRGVCGCASQTDWGNRPREIYHYVGPDGQGVTMKWNTKRPDGGWQGSYLEARDPVAAVNYLDGNATFLSVWPWAASAAFGYGGDLLESTQSLFPQTSLAMSTASRRVIVSNEVDFFQDFEANFGAQIPTFTGSFGNEWDLYQASMGAVAADFKRTIEKLRTAEALATVVSLQNPNFMTGRDSLRDQAFMSAGLFYEHNWTADGPVTRARRALWEREMLADLHAYVDPLYADGLAALGGLVRNPAGAERYVIFNPLSWGRQDFVDLTVLQSAPLHVVDVTTGLELPSQVMSTGPTVVRILAGNVPSVGYRVVEVRAGGGATFPAAATVTLPTFDNGLYAVTLGGRGQVASIVDHRIGDRQLVDVAGGGTVNELYSGSGAVVVESSGPVSTTLRVVAGGTPLHQARVTMYAGLDRIDVEDRITQNFSQPEGWVSKFALPGAVMHHEEVGMIARVARAANGGDYADQNARTDYLSFGHFVDLSQDTLGVTVSNWDCSFFKAGNSTITSLDASTPAITAVVGMQVDGGSLGIPSQGGDTLFVNRFAMRRHRAYDPVAAMCFALEHQNPLVAVRVTGGTSSPLSASSWTLLQLSPTEGIVWAVKPADDGIAQGIVARVWNLADTVSTFNLSLSMGVAAAELTTHVETDLHPATIASGMLTDALARQQLRTYRILPKGPWVDAPPNAAGRLALACWPNPLGSGARAVLAFTLPETTRVRVTIHDLRGAVVARLWDGVLPAGGQRLAWDRRDARGGRARPGVYFATVESGGVRASRRLVVLE